jgi:hypothetical protein
VAAVLEALRDIDSLDGLRERYRTAAGEWASRLVPESAVGRLGASDRRRAEGAGFGLRWLELDQGLWCDATGSLVGQIPPSLLARLVSETPSALGA